MTEAEDRQTHRQPLHFEDDPGASRSTWVAGAILLAIVGWMGSGFVLPSEEEEPPQAAAEGPEPVAVAVRMSAAEPVTLYFEAEGQALPDRDTAIRAEMSGEVDEILVAKGADVAKGDVIAQLKTEELEADLRRAIEAREQAQLEYDNATALLDRGVATLDRVAQASAALASAEAQVTAAQEAIGAAGSSPPSAAASRRCRWTRANTSASAARSGAWWTTAL